MYESDLTKFMREFLQQHPEEVESQRVGRATWWDKTPEERSPHPSMRHTHAPRAGGAEHSFVPSGGYEWSFQAEDDDPGLDDDAKKRDAG